MSTRTLGRIIGALYLLAFVVYLPGGLLADTGASTTEVQSDLADSPAQIPAGALLMLTNAFLVAAIGVLVYVVLKARHEIAAVAVLVSRVFEAVLLAVGVVFILLLVPIGQDYAGDGSALPALVRVAQEGNHYAYLLAMIAVSAGGIVLCRALFLARMIPRGIAVWGLAGYAVFLAGAGLEVLGYGVSTVMAVPGGLFEIAFGVLLIAKGFTPEPHHPLSPDATREEVSS